LLRKEVGQPMQCRQVAAFNNNLKDGVSLTMQATAFIAHVFKQRTNLLDQSAERARGIILGLHPCKK
jgi:hypothetical protein